MGPARKINSLHYPDLQGKVNLGEPVRDLQKIFSCPGTHGYAGLYVYEAKMQHNASHFTYKTRSAVINLTIIL